MQEIIVLAAGLGVSQCILTILLLLNYVKRSVAAIYGIMLAVCVMNYFLAPLTEKPFSTILYSMMPVFILLSTREVFEYRSPLNVVEIALMAVLIFVPTLVYIWLGPAGYSRPFFLKTHLAVIGLILMSMALFTIVKSWSNDLVQERRKIRLVFVVGGIGFISLIYIIRASSSYNYSFNDYFAFELFLSVFIVTAINYRFMLPSQHPLVEVLGMQSQDEAKKDRKRSQIDSDKLSKDVLLRLHGLMSEEKIYREMSLGIGQLAARMNIPEYKLRQTINFGLGYRNFNDFLNSYRIQEAAQRLVEERETPVLNIAMEVGFRSLSTFHQKFKETYGITPAKYRTRECA